MGDIFQAMVAVLTLLVIGAMAYLTYQAVKHPAEFASNITKTASKLMLDYRVGMFNMLDRGFDQSIGTIPVIGKSLSGVAKAAVYLPTLPITKPFDIGSALIGGNTSGAWNAIKSTPTDIYHSIASIF